MLGIKFEIPNTYDITLYKILGDIHFHNRIVKIEEEEVLSDKGLEFFDKEIYSFSEFEEKIMKTDHYTIFLNLQIYNTENYKSPINDYEQFLNSDCQLVLFITDNVDVEIYSKNEEWLRLIENNVVNFGFKKSELIIDKTSVRKKFSAYF